MEKIPFTQDEFHLIEHVCREFNFGLKLELIKLNEEKLSIDLTLRNNEKGIEHIFISKTDKINHTGEGNSPDSWDIGIEVNPDFFSSPKKFRERLDWLWGHLSKTRILYLNGKQYYEPLQKLAEKLTPEFKRASMIYVESHVALAKVKEFYLGKSSVNFQVEQVKGEYEETHWSCGKSWDIANFSLRKCILPWMDPFTYQEASNHDLLDEFDLEKEYLILEFSGYGKPRLYLIFNSKNIPKKLDGDLHEFVQLSNTYQEYYQSNS